MTASCGSMQRVSKCLSNPNPSPVLSLHNFDGKLMRINDSLRRALRQCANGADVVRERV